jgi:hypothetical protein
MSMSVPKKNLLLFTNKLGYQTRSFEEAARRHEVRITYVTDRCHQLEDPWGDHAVAVHFEAPQAAAAAVLEAMRGKGVNGIIALGDRPTVTAAYAARELGVPYNHPAAVEACRSKLRTREVFREAGLPTPWFRAMGLTPLPEPALLQISYPCVLKPVSLSASRGVMRANSHEEFRTGAARLKKLLSSPEIRATRESDLERMLVEGYIAGKEVAVEGLISDGVLRILAIFDKPDSLEGPFFEETIYVTPSRLPDEQQRAIAKCAGECARAIGLTNGPVHAEFRVDDENVWPLEIAARPIGGLCARALRFMDRSAAAGRHDAIGLEELLLRQALQLPVSGWVREAKASAVMMIPVPHSGTLEAVEGEAPARATPGVTELLITARWRDYIEAWPEGSSYLGFIFSSAETPEEAETILRQAHAKLRFVLTPRLPVEHPLRTSSERPSGSAN